MVWDSGSAPVVNDPFHKELMILSRPKTRRKYLCKDGWETSKLQKGKVSARTAGMADGIPYTEPCNI